MESTEPLFVPIPSLLWQGLEVITAGDTIRAEIKKGGHAAEVMRSYVDSGRLIPDEMVGSLVHKALLAPAIKEGFILGASPGGVGIVSLPPPRAPLYILWSCDGRCLLPPVAGGKCVRVCPALSGES
jgi:hypothetical protein